MLPELPFVVAQPWRPSLPPIVIRRFLCAHPECDRIIVTPSRNHGPYCDQHQRQLRRAAWRGRKR